MISFAKICSAEQGLKVASFNFYLPFTWMQLLKLTCFNNKSQCKFWLKIITGKIYLKKIFILVYFDSQKQGRKKIWNPTLSFWRRCWHAPKTQLDWSVWHFHLAHGSKEKCRNSNFFPPLLIAIDIDLNIFFLRDMFCI